MRRSVTFIATLLVAASSSAAEIYVQSPIGERGVYLTQQRGIATVVDGERRDALPGTEVRYLALAELDDGCIATGIRETPGRAELAIYQRRGEALERLAPPQSAAPFRGGAVPLVSDGRLVGLAWLEGPGHDALSVVAAGWSGVDWNRVETVATPQHGTQIALQGVVLDDGTWLLLWSSFDGTDDETVWSRRVGETWSAPLRLHPDNEVPDILPTVVAVPGGALAAWSTYDEGEYRLRLAHFDGAVWSDPRFIAEPGTLKAFLRRTEEGAQLLYRRVVPSAWHLIGLDGRGTAMRRHATDTADLRRPIIGDANEGLSWPQTTGPEPSRRP